MKTVDDVRSEVIRHLISFLVSQPAIRRLQRIPNERDVTDDMLLRDLKLDYRDNRLLGLWLTRRKLCAKLDVYVTMPWKTVGDVVTSVIRFPWVHEPLRLRLDKKMGIYTAPDPSLASQGEAVKRAFPGANVFEPSPRR